jgi:hypothetical protein
MATTCAGVASVAEAGLEPRTRPPTRRTQRTAWWVAGIGLIAVCARLPFLARPLSPDEGGFLLVASQWSPGRSLYGDYWVDRPPLLIDFFVLADRLGGTVALRSLGLGLVLLSVLAAGRVGYLSAGTDVSAPTGRTAAVLSAATSAVFLVTPLFGTSEINGELIATPLVLTSIAFGIEATRRPVGRSRDLTLVLAGAAATAAVLVKQNQLDAVVFVVVAAFTVHRTVTGTSAARTLAPAALGGVGVIAALLAQAAHRGTRPAGLWDAVVTFRMQAASVIRSSATSATTDRLHTALLALIASGAPLIVVLLVTHRRQRPPATALDLRWPTAAVLAWEVLAVLGGGSYWLHYLICLVPGLVLSVAVVASCGASSRWTSWLTRAGLGYAVVSCLVALTAVLLHPPPQDPVVTWLRAHSRPGETAVVAFGHPDYLRDAALTSPYSQLWSLPVRVRDPDLAELTTLLAGSDRPRWLVTGSSGRLSGWGLGDRRIFEAAPSPPVPTA